MRLQCEKVVYTDLEFCHAAYPTIGVPSDLYPDTRLPAPGIPYLWNPRPENSFAVRHNPSQYTFATLTTRLQTTSCNILDPESQWYRE